MSYGLEGRFFHTKCQFDVYISSPLQGEKPQKYEDFQNQILNSRVSPANVAQWLMHSYAMCSAA